jgi:hypothetical protein
MQNPTRSRTSPAARERRTRRTAIIVTAALLATFVIPVLAVVLS